MNTMKDKLSQTVDNKGIQWIDAMQTVEGTQAQNLGQNLKNKQLEEHKHLQNNECPVKDEEGNCLVPGTYGDSAPIGGG